MHKRGLTRGLGWTVCFFCVIGPDLYWSDILMVLYDVMSLTNSDEL